MSSQGGRLMRRNSTLELKNGGLEAWEGQRRQATLNLLSAP